ncbi:MAG: hypothetical protein PVF57_19135 [Pseudomonadales bacterium]|jgi:hypothetical protein
MRIRWIWLVLAVAYAAFFGWYTSFGGPLSDSEIDHYMDYFESRDPPPPPERLAMLERFMREDTGDDFVMVNVIDMYDTPLGVPGVEPGDTSEDVLAKYMQYMWPALLSRASHPVFVGTAANTAMDLMHADGMETWSQAAGMRYRSRRDMLEITTNPAFSGSHEFKIAAMRKTIAFPVDPWFQLGDPRLVLALVLGLLGCALSWRAATRGTLRGSSPPEA